MNYCCIDLEILTTGKLKKSESKILSILKNAFAKIMEEEEVEWGSEESGDNLVKDGKKVITDPLSL